MVWIERMMAALAAFIACDLFNLDSRDVEQARARRAGPVERPAEAAGERRQVVVRFGR